MARKKVIDLDCNSIVKLEKQGQSAEGYYLGNKTINTEYGPSKLHVFQGEDGNFGIFGAAKLDQKLASVLTGSLTYVTFEGKVKLPGGKTMKKFNVEYDDEQIIDVADVSVNYQTSQEPAEDDAQANDVDDDTIEAAEDEEEAPPANVAKRPLARGAPTTVTTEQKARVERLLSQAKR